MKNILLFLSLSAIANVASALTMPPSTLDGMDKVTEWTDYENQTGEMPGFIWGTSDTDGANKIGIFISFESGDMGSLVLSNVSAMWNTHTVMTSVVDSSSGFMSSFGTFTHLYNVASSTTNYPQALPMAWISSTMAFTNNFDLDYNDQNNSHFRASVGGWGSAVFASYSSTATASVPDVGNTFAFLGLVFLGLASVRRRFAK